ncbi:toxin VasX [Halomonas salifodinae]|uniref:toxin VasX n=1 Tax=Halomonas salifodinae TaxID=438745 RepID=UPI0033B4C327
MSAFERPHDDRDDGTLAAHELPCRDSEEGATCPLLDGTVQLLPLRYGLVEELEPGCTTPYTLSARPLGIRMLRNGYLYVLDGNTNELHEYEFRNQGNTTSGHNEGKLEYATDRTLYVCFSEVQWTAAKRAQVQESEADRDAFMQAVDLAGANPISGGGEHLITTTQAERWVAEFAEAAEREQPEGGHPQEGEAYHWENDHYYHQTRLGKLLKQHKVKDRDTCLCLVVRDDIGVMRDLAMYQDNVVGWIEEWASQENGQVERDYVLASYIESIPQLTQEALDALAELDRETERETLWNTLESLDNPEDLENLDSEVAERTRQAVTDYLNHEGPLPPVDEASLSAEVQAELRALDSQIETIRPSLGHSISSDLVRMRLRTQRSTILQRESTRRMLSEADSGFVESHLDGLIELRQEQRQRVRDMLHGAKLGQRGVNGLVRREEMDTFLTLQRAKLSRWNELLERISADRVDMLCDDRFHLAAWYFDPQDATQVEEALCSEYAVTRDIGRSDEANERIFTWLQANPHFDRPMFYTLSVADGTALIRDYATLYGIGHSVLSETPEWIGQLVAMEEGKLPDVAALEEPAKAAADKVRANLTPAVGVGIERAMAGVSEALEGRGQMPSIEELFRSSEMPKVLGPRLIDAARRGDLTFHLASIEELDAFKRALSRVLGLRENLRSLNNQIRQARRASGTNSQQVRTLKHEKAQVQVALNHYERLLAESLSPVEALPEEKAALVAAVDDPSLGRARAGITLTLPLAQQREISRLVRNFRLGISSTANVMNITGDGLSLAIFVAQAVNLVQAYQAYTSLPSHAPIRTHVQAGLNVANALFSTGAAGFLTAQGIGQTVLERQARALGEALGSGPVSARLGIMHFGLGSVGYLSGFAAAGLGLINNGSNFAEAVRSGQSRAQLGASTAMAGNLGMMGAHGHGLRTTFRVGGEIRRGATTWATAGARLGSLFWRINLVGLAFTALELAGSWMYNRYNLSKHDQWLLDSPWGTEHQGPGGRPLEHYLQTLESVLQPTHAVIEAHYGETMMPAWFDSLTEGIRNPAKYSITLHMPNVSPTMLDALGGQPPLRLALRLWRLTPSGPRGRWSSSHWEEITEAWAGGMVTTTDSRQHAGLVVSGETPPEERGKVRYVVGVRYSWPNGEGEYHSDEQYILIRPRHGRDTGPKHRYMPEAGLNPDSTHGDWHNIDGRAIVLPAASNH